MIDMDIFSATSRMLGVLASVLGIHKALRGLSAWRESSRKGRLDDSLSIVRDIYQVLQGECLPGDRVSIFRCHNGVGIPTPGRTAYSTYVYSVGHEPLQGKWDRVPVDDASAEIIHEALAGTACYAPGGMPEGMMSLSVKAAGFQYVSIACIKTCPDGTWFVQIDSQKSTTKRRFEMAVLANRLRDLIQ